MRKDYQDANKEMAELFDKNFKVATIQRESLKGNLNFIELNENTLNQNMCNGAKAALTEKFIVH